MKKSDFSELAEAIYRGEPVRDLMTKFGLQERGGKKLKDIISEDIEGIHKDLRNILVMK